MLRPSSAMVAAALVVIPTSAGICHLATSSSTKNSEQVETPEESIRREEREETQALSKSLISQIVEMFDYGRIKPQDERSNQIQAFVEETERIREHFQNSLNGYLLYQEEYTDKSIKDIISQDTELTPIELTNGDNHWSKLVKARQEEVPVQLYLDSGDDSQSLSPVGSEVTKEDIKKFCEDPSEANSHLGMHSPTRTDKETKQDYMLFSYYSYCTNESHYLNEKVSLWN